MRRLGCILTRSGRTKGINTRDPRSVVSLWFSWLRLPNIMSHWKVPFSMRFAGQEPQEEGVDNVKDRISASIKLYQLLGAKDNNGRQIHLPFLKRNLFYVKDQKSGEEVDEAFADAKPFVKRRLLSKNSPKKPQSDGERFFNLHLIVKALRVADELQTTASAHGDYSFPIGILAQFMDGFDPLYLSQHKPFVKKCLSLSKISPESVVPAFRKLWKEYLVEVEPSNVAYRFALSPKPRSCFLQIKDYNEVPCMYEFYMFEGVPETLERLPKWVKLDPDHCSHRDGFLFDLKPQEELKGFERSYILVVGTYEPDENGMPTMRRFGSLLLYNFRCGTSLDSGYFESSQGIPMVDWCESDGIDPYFLLEQTFEQKPILPFQSPVKSCIQNSVYSLVAYIHDHNGTPLASRDDLADTSHSNLSSTHQKYVGVFPEGHNYMDGVHKEPLPNEEPMPSCGAGGLDFGKLVSKFSKNNLNPVEITYRLFFTRGQPTVAERRTADIDGHREVDVANWVNSDSLLCVRSDSNALKCLFCERKFPNTYALLMHCNNNYTRLSFLLSNIFPMLALFNICGPVIDVYLNDSYIETPISKKKEVVCKFNEPAIWVVTKCQKRLLESYMRIDLDVFTDYSYTKPSSRNTYFRIDEHYNCATGRLESANLNKCKDASESWPHPGSHHLIEINKKSLYLFTDVSDSVRGFALSWNRFCLKFGRNQAEIVGIYMLMRLYIELYRDWILKQGEKFTACLNAFFFDGLQYCDELDYYVQDIQQRLENPLYDPLDETNGQARHFIADKIVSARTKIRRVENDMDLETAKSYLGHDVYVRGVLDDDWKEKLRDAVITASMFPYGHPVYLMLTPTPKYIFADGTVPYCFLDPECTPEIIL
ncbi:unnamed protein product [Caenorhabditis auriculariae]|uniref:Uncharacterized protein n=1 Tax=Caenorhabditis auriculariae TaxID=2777116 RepID=A0A8S1HBK9_9PELO|nr:unnamed protein product [Caenorhabditis auriculariae]